MSPTLHCSIIGTCLSTAELRRVLAKGGLDTADASDHRLHKEAVQLAERHDGAAKLLNKLLDERHRLTIRQFERARTAEELRSLWRAARDRGDIPGAYWAALTHPAADDAAVTEAFGDVHMLSHLVGAANRADIRRLSVLEQEKAELEAKVLKQQDRLREAVTSRDAKIRELNALLTDKLASDARNPAEDPTGGTARDGMAQLAADLERRRGDEAHRRRLAEERLQACRAELARERELRAAAELREVRFREELEALESSMADEAADEPARAVAAPRRLDGVTILYVGGRPSQAVQIRDTAARLGAAWLHHDGGKEEGAGLLPALIARADAVLFPVDCVSHAAVSIVKQLCRHADKPYLPLRSGGLGSFLTAVQRIDLAGAGRGASA